MVDDEPIAIRALRTLLEPLDDVEIAGTCSNALEARRALREKDIDLVLFDIEMPQLTGIDLVEAMERPPRFIFTTAYREYAFKAYDLDAVDYLLKPISLPRLLRALDKYRRRAADLAKPSDKSAVIYLRVDRRTVKVDPADVFYAESVGDYVKLKTGGGVLMSKLPLSELEAELPDGEFVRIHRSFIVSLAHVDAFTGTRAEVAGRILPISRTYRERALIRLRGKR